MISSLEIIFLVMILQFYQRLGAVATTFPYKDIIQFLLKPNKHKGKSGHSSGGITLFYKRSCQTKLKVLKQSKHYIWLRLSSCIRNLSNELKDLYICITYIPQLNFPTTPRTFSQVSRMIFFFLIRMKAEFY